MRPRQMRTIATALLVLAVMASGCSRLARERRGETFIDTADLTGDQTSARMTPARNHHEPQHGGEGRDPASGVTMPVPGVRPGDLLRIIGGKDGDVVGEVVSIDGTAVVLDPGGGVTAAVVDVHWVTSIMRSGGTRNRAHEGILIGGLIGLAAGVTVSTMEDPGAFDVFYSRRDPSGPRYEPIVFGAVAGATAGGLIGALFDVPVWEPLDVGAAPGGGTVAAAWRF